MLNPYWHRPVMLVSPREWARLEAVMGRPLPTIGTLPTGEIICERNTWVQADATDVARHKRPVHALPDAPR